MNRSNRIQRLRSKLGHVRYDVTSRVATTISSIRDKSYAYAGFPTRLGAAQDDPSDPADMCGARYMPLRKTIVRALLGHEVTYEPSSRLKKSRKAVVLITGADLVLVKMTKDTSTASSGNMPTEAQDAAGAGTSAGGLAGSADSTAAAAGSATATAAGTGAAKGSARSDAGLDAAVMAADARASVLAQHELNKMVKCEVCGDRLDLEFIVTGGAQFKVSTAALGTNAASLSTLTPSALSTSSLSKWAGRLEEELDEEDTEPMAAAAAAATEPGPGPESEPDSAHALSNKQRAMRSKSEPMLLTPKSDKASPFDNSSMADSAAAVTATTVTGGAGPAAAAVGGGSAGSAAARQQVPQASASAPSDSLGMFMDEAAAVRLQHYDFAERAGSRSLDGPTAMGSRTLGRWISRYSSTTSSSSGVMQGVGSPPAANGMSLSAVGGGPGRSGFVRSLGSLTLGVTDEAARSSFRPVKTDDGEYIVWVEAFSLTFGSPALAEMAADLLRNGHSSMRQALEWLKQGLPFKPGFAVTHITQLNSRAGDEVLRAGPTPWGTVLQLPDSWVEVVRDAQLPEDQPLNTPLEVQEGPAAFKVHLATPAGLAEATLSPELIAVLSQQPCTNGQVLAVPVILAVQTTEADAEQQQQEQQEQQVAQRAPSLSGSSPRVRAVDAKPGPDLGESSNQPIQPPTKPLQQQPQHKDQEEGPAAAASTGATGPHATDKLRSPSHKGLTWADQQQQCSADPVGQVDAVRRSSIGGCTGAASQQAVVAPAAGRGGLAMQHSRSMPQLQHLEQLTQQTDTSADFDSCDDADLADQPLLQQGFAAGPQYDSRSSSLPILRASQEAASAKPDVSDVSRVSAASESAAAAAGGSEDDAKPAASGLLGINRQQSSAQLAFAAEVHAVLHVRLLLHCEDGSGATLDLPTDSSRLLDSPFAVSGAAHLVGSEGGLAPLSPLDPQHSIRPAPSVLLLGPAQPSRPSAAQQQLLQTAAALLAALLCGLALLLLNTNAAALLVLAAAVANAACAAISLQPAWCRRVCQGLEQLLRLRPAPSSAHDPSRRHHHNHHHHHHHQHAAGLQHHYKHHSFKSQHSKGTDTAAAAGAVAAATGQERAAAAAAEVHGRAGAGHSNAGGCQRNLQGLRLQLLGGSFVKEALGLLEQQINAYRHLQELQDASSYTSESDIDDLESVSSDDDDHEMFKVVFVSSPEPSWMNRDWRRRLWHARPNNEERCKLATSIHAWRESVGAGTTLLQHPPASFDWFQQHLVLRPLLKTPQGHLVVLLKLNTLSLMPRMLPTAGLTPTCLMRYCGFLWRWMFEEYALGEWPSARFVLLADMSGLKLGQAVGEGQVGGRALGEVCNAYPERLLRCLVLGAPSWFNMLFRLIRPQLSPSTRAKVQVCTNTGEAVAELSCCLGGEWVPAEYGGKCQAPYDDYPAQKALLQFVAKLREQSP